MFDRILVPLDRSALAERAIPYAIALAQVTNGHIVLLHAIPSGLALHRGEAELDAAARLDELADQLRHQGIRVDARTVPGNAAEAIVATAGRAHTDVIVMSTHGRGGLGRWLYGSVADQVLRWAEVPILLVSAACDHPWPTDRPLKMLVSLDGSETSEAVLDSARQLGQILGADAIFLRVIEPTASSVIGYDPAHFRIGQPEADGSLAEASGYLEGITGQPASPFRSVDTIVDVGEPAARITALARQESVDLIVMATHGRAGLARLTMGSVATATLHRTHVPMLLMRPAGLRESDMETPDAASRQ
jgi:nucleotide-binding universal stress UspA family protein